MKNSKVKNTKKEYSFLSYSLNNKKDVVIENYYKFNNKSSNSSENNSDEEESNLCDYFAKTEICPTSDKIKLIKLFSGCVKFFFEI